MSVGGSVHGNGGAEIARVKARYWDEDQRRKEWLSRADQGEPPTEKQRRSCQAPRAFVEYEGRQVAIRDLRRRAGVSSQVYWVRRRRGWDRITAATTPPIPASKRRLGHKP